MQTSYAKFLDRLREVLLGSSGVLPLSTRENILAGRILERPLNGFVVRVRANASSVTPEHLKELLRSGLLEDEVFEAAICAAVVAGFERYESGMKALRDGSHAP